MESDDGGCGGNHGNEELAVLSKMKLMVDVTPRLMAYFEVTIVKPTPNKGPPPPH